MTSPQKISLYGLAVCLCFLLASCGTSTSYSSGQPADPPPFYAEKPDLPPASTEKPKAEETAKQALLEEPQQSKTVSKAVKTTPAKQETKAATAKTATKVTPPPKAQIKTTTRTTAKTAATTKVQTAAKQPVVSPVPDSNALPPYRLQVGDVLRIRLLLNPELDEDVIVRPDGMISTALVQNLQAYGLTPLELQNSLIKYYKQQLTDPRISVIVQSFAPTRVYVLGEVKSPGEFISVDANPTVLQAIARAGGMLDSAERDQILVLRRAPGQPEKVFKIDYDAAFYGKDLRQDIRLAAQDIVIIPRSGVADVYHYYRQYLQQFLPASLGFGYDLNNN